VVVGLGLVVLVKRWPWWQWMEGVVVVLLLLVFWWAVVGSLERRGKGYRRSLFGE
jgi:hypothetical protein